MTNQVVEIRKIQDDSVAKKINKTANQLTKKYYRKRKINDTRLLKGKTPFQRIMSGCVTTIMAIVILICCLLCFTMVAGRVQNIPPNFMGYNLMQISSGSMKASGFEVGDKIITRTVDTNTLKPGDRISFYVYKNSYTQFYNVTRHQVTDFDKEVKYDLTLPLAFGFQTDEKREAVKANSKIVFHEIVKVYEDGNGCRWFKTKGSSNTSEDVWYIHEDMVIGVYDSGAISGFMSVLLNFLTSRTGLIYIVLLPLLLLAIIIICDMIKNVKIVFLELDVVEEKRKLTDEICVKNNVGYQMSKNTKYKVLAQAKDDEKMLYLSLLWPNGTAPNSIKKHYLRKSIILRPMRKLLEVNRECEQMIKGGIPPNKVAKYYLTQKANIEEEKSRYKKLLNNIHKKYMKGDMV